MWDARTGQELGVPLAGSDHLVSSVAFSPDGKRHRQRQRDKTVKVWDAQTGQETLHPQGAHDWRVAAWPSAPTASGIVSGSEDGTAEGVGRGPAARSRSPSRGTQTACRSVAFSPDGKRIVSGQRGQDR